MQLINTTPTKGLELCCRMLMLSLRCHMSGECALGKRQPRPLSLSCSCKTLSVQLPADGLQSCQALVPAYVPYNAVSSAIKGTGLVHIALLNICPVSGQMKDLALIGERDRWRTCR